MYTTEEKLKDYILTRYKSLREFTISNDIPHSTFVSILKRGVANSSISNIIKICDALNISVDALANGEIAPAKKIKSSPINDRFEVKEIIEDTIDILTHRKVTLDGEPLSKKGIASIVDAMEIGVEMAKRK